jgi:hypothetical protein
MPWNVERTDRCPAGRPWGVIGGESGDDLRGCHPTQQAARQQQKALYAAEAKSQPGWAEGIAAPSPRIWLTL